MSDEIFPIGTNIVIIENDNKFIHGLITQIRSPINDHDVSLYIATFCDGRHISFSFEEIANLNQHYIELGTWQKKKRYFQ